MSALIILLVIMFLSFGFHFALQHRICALVGGIVPLLCVALAQLHVQLQMPVALVVTVFPFAVPFAWATSAIVPSTSRISIVVFVVVVAALNAGYYALVAGAIGWGWRRLSARSLPAYWSSVKQRWKVGRAVWKRARGL